MVDHLVDVTNRLDNVPIAVTGHAMLCVHGCGLYLIGGWNHDYNDSSGNFDSHFVRHVWKYSFWAHKWTKLRSAESLAPISLSSHSAFLLSPNKFVIYGGSLASLGVLCIDNKCTKYNVNVEQWMDLACEGSLPPHSVGHYFGVNCVHDVHNNCIYVATGMATAYPKTVMHKLDLHTWRWEKLSTDCKTEPPCRVRAQLILHDRKLYLLGGISELFGLPVMAYSMETMPTFCLHSKSWSETRITPHFSRGCPTNVTCFGCCQSNEDTVFVHGGVVSAIPSDNTPFNGILWKLDMQTKQWSIFDVVSPLPALWFHQMCFNNDDSCIYIFGGCKTRDCFGARDNCLRRVRVSVPSLSCLCLETMAKASNYYSSMQLWVDAGIPKHILRQRLEF